YPIGGSTPIVESIERRYLALGGKLSFRKKVQKVLVQNNHAVGVRFVDGSEQMADYVISAADGHETIFEMLDGKFIGDTIRGYFETFKVYTPMLYIGLGVNRSFEDFPQIISGIRFELEKPIAVG